MKKNKLIILLIIVAGILLVIGYGYREYYRKPASMETVTADLAIQANQLMDQYQANETTANSKYLGKVLEVTGNIASINNEQDTLINILLGNKEALAHVSCSMSATALVALKSLKPGSEATIRGVCTGYLMDVELNRCILVK